MKFANFKELHKLLILQGLLTALLIVSSKSLAAKQIEKPWLQGLNNNSIYILVESESKKDIEIFYSKSNEFANNFKSKKTLFYKKTGDGGNTYIHRILLENLEYGKKYYYTLDKKEIYSFRMPENSGCLTFANMGDNRSGPMIWADISKQMHLKKPDFSIFNGDLAVTEEYDKWINEFFIPETQEFIAQIPFYNAVGNHEGWHTNTEAFLQSPYVDDKKQAFYSFERGEAFYLILSTEHNVQPNSAQWKLAVNALKNTDKKWKIVSFHIPAYSSGGANENANMKRMTSEIFEKYGVNVILTGHSHYFQHNLVNDIHHFVIGGGGSPLYTPKKADYTIEQAKKYHFAIFEVCKNSIKIEVFNRKGEKYYEYVIEG